MKLYIYEFKMANMTLALCKEHCAPKELHKIAKGGARFIVAKETDGSVQCDRCAELEKTKQGVFRFIKGYVTPKEEGVTVGTINLRHLRMLAKEYTDTFLFKKDKKHYLEDIKEIVKDKHHLKEEDPIQLRVERDKDISITVGIDTFEFDVYQNDSDVGDKMIDMAERILYTLSLKDTCAKEFRGWVRRNLPEWAKPTNLNCPCEVCGCQESTDKSILCQDCLDDGWFVDGSFVNGEVPYKYSVDEDQMTVFLVNI